MNKLLTKSSVKLNLDENHKLLLRYANANDIEYLRRWKNEQREFFFYKENINSEQQRSWFEGHQERPYDFMFMVDLDGLSVGCMGIRWLETHWDIYNVILGRDEFGGRGIMGKAFKAMLAYALSNNNAPITLQVLKHNPAIKWYRKNGFVVTDEHDNYYAMKYEPCKTNQELQ